MLGALGLWVVIFESPLVADLIRACGADDRRFVYTHLDVGNLLLELAGQAAPGTFEKFVRGYLYGVWSCQICQAVLIAFFTASGFHLSILYALPFWWWPVTFITSLPISRWLQKTL